jgi:(1->4)-alpha-D-glucan 1-alpha-D-glucosylmutase
MSEGRRVPSATYRLQFNADFTFDDASELVPYLHELGISHCYASPYLRARSGSPHGYDIVDHNTLNPEIGNAESFERFVRVLQEHGMGHILDLVPNHMGVGGNDNAWWLDVLENGPASAFASFFDIDWRPVKEELRGKILVPLLGDHYGRILDAGELQFKFDAQRGEFSVYYYEHRFPIDPGTYPRILEHRLDQLKARLAEDDPHLLELQSLVTAFGHLPPREEVSPERLEERRRDKEVHKRHLAALCEQSEEVTGYLAALVDEFNGQEYLPRSHDLLHDLLEAQAYRLAYWRVASDDINYRRFFDINDLAGLRMEEPEVFDVTHRYVFELLGAGKLDGLRIDHPDGLYDPKGYFRHLCRTMPLPDEAASGAPDETGRHSPPAYLVVEKILAAYEHLPQDWPVDGTTGYDFANTLNGLFVYPASEQEHDRIYARFVGYRFDFDELLYERKKLAIRIQLSSELTVLANMLDYIAETSRYTRDFTLNGLRDALIEVVASFPVYRTYVTGEQVSTEDRRYVDWAIAQAKKRTPAGETTIFDFVRSILLDGVNDPDDGHRLRATRFVMKFQQYTAPVMAKALEDTAFYIYNRLVSLNEVGGDPRRFGVSVAAFHRNNLDRAQHWPHAMTATSTHDAKRSEDVRARIDAISEMPTEWQHHIARWSRSNRSRKMWVDGVPAPSRNDEYLIYQTLLGAWPLEESDPAMLECFRERMKDYVLKAVREAKVHTSWVNANAGYEEATARFVEQILSTPEQSAFLNDFIPFQRKVARFGLLNSLSQTLLKLASPGVPDTYQGMELWQFHLVDPDNRRRVDYGRHRALLNEVKEQFEHAERRKLLHELQANMEDGRAKLLLTWQTLQLRRQWPELLVEGEYIPLTCGGQHAEHLCAFARRRADTLLLTVAPRWFARLTGGNPTLPLPAEIWTGTHVDLSPLGEPGDFTDILGGRHFSPAHGRLEAADLFSDFPVALLLHAPQ